MTSSIPQYLVGVDGCRAGWLCFRVHARGRDVEVNFVSCFHDLLQFEGFQSLIAIDIPIGLPSAGSRDCDVAARKLLGRPRGSAVFPAPVRAVLRARTFGEACSLSRDAHSKAISRQAFAIVPKIREVDNRMTPDMQGRIYEVHPEVSFWAMNGQQAMRHSKRKREGLEERLNALSSHFSNIPELLASVDSAWAKPDDLLDAAAAAWSAERIAGGDGTCVTDSVQIDTKDLRMNIFY